MTIPDASARSEAPPPPTLDGVLQEQKLSRQQVRIWFLSAAGIALDGFDYFVIGAALPLIKQSSMEPSPAELGAVGAAALLGAVLGSLLLAPVTDRVGRSFVYRLNPLFFMVMSAAAALSPGVWTLVCCQFLLGIGIGADYPVSASYVSESMPPRHRGRLVASTIGFQSFGMLLGLSVGLLMAHVINDVNAWRWMIGFGAIPAGLLFLARLAVPESPRWLVAQGKRDRAQRAFSEITGIPEAKLSQALFVRSGPPSPKARLHLLFRPEMIRRTVLSSVPWFLMDIATYGIGIFTPTILAHLHAERLSRASGTHHSSVITNEISSLEGAAFVDAFLLVGFALGIALIDILGRIRLQTLGFLGMTAALILLAFHGDTHTSVGWTFAGFIAFNIFMNMGPNSTTYVLPSELFPTRIRATGHGFASASGKIGAALGAFGLPVLLSAVGLRWTLMGVAAAALTGATITVLFRIETQGVDLTDD